MARDAAAATRVLVAALRARPVDAVGVVEEEAVPATGTLLATSKKAVLPPEATTVVTAETTARDLRQLAVPLPSATIETVPSLPS